MFLPRKKRTLSPKCVPIIFQRKRRGDRADNIKLLVPLHNGNCSNKNLGGKKVFVFIYLKLNIPIEMGGGMLVKYIIDIMVILLRRIFHNFFPS